VFGARLAQERVEQLGLAARGLDVVAGSERQLCLGPPVHAMVERGLGDHAFANAGHVRRRDVDQPRRGVVRERRLVEADRADQVGLEPLVDRRVERHRGRAVDHDVDPARDLELLGREVAVDHVDALGQHGRDPLLPGLVPQRAEGRPAHQGLDPLAPARAQLWPHEQRDPGLGEVEQEPLEHGLPEEAGHARDQHVHARQGPHDRARRARGRARVLYHAADYASSTKR
jgi:hypothetical protein